MGRTRVELWGHLVKPPELRVTPSGRPLLHLTLECGSVSEPLALEVTMTGEESRRVAAALKPGHKLQVVGSLKAIVRRDKAGLRMHQVAVVATEIRPAA